MAEDKHDIDEGAFAGIPSLAALYDKLEELETLERQKPAEPAERGGNSRERSFWKAWTHIARWREQEVDALKEGKAKVFHRRQSRWAMTIVFHHWLIETTKSHSIYCSCCQMSLNGPDQYEDHIIGKKHRKCSRRPPYALDLAASSA